MNRNIFKINKLHEFIRQVKDIEQSVSAFKQYCYDETRKGNEPTKEHFYEEALSKIEQLLSDMREYEINSGGKIHGPFYSLVDLKQQIFAELAPFRQLKNPLSSTKKPTLKKVVKNEWKGGANKLKSLYQKLLGAYIDKATTFEEFSNLFSEEISIQIKPVTWLKSIRLLTYLLDEIRNAALIHNNDYQSALGNTERLQNVRGKIITRIDLANAKTAYADTINRPQGYKGINQIIANL